MKGFAQIYFDEGNVFRPFAPQLDQPGNDVKNLCRLASCSPIVFLGGSDQGLGATWHTNHFPKSFCRCGVKLMGRNLSSDTACQIEGLCSER